MNYPCNIKKTFEKKTSYANRGMDLETLINISSEIYLEKGLAAIFKKPTPIQVVKYDYSKKRITDAFYKTQSTLDYNGIYKGYYVEFDAKNSNGTCLPLANIEEHQFKQIETIIKHKGITFLIIKIKNEIYILNGKNVLECKNNSTRKSISYDYIIKNGYKLSYDYLKGVDYLPGIDYLIKENVI